MSWSANTMRCIFDLEPCTNTQNVMSFNCYLNIQMYIQIKNTYQTCDRRLCPDTVTWIEYDSTNWCILYPTNLYETVWIWLVHPHLYFVAI